MIRIDGLEKTLNGQQVLRGVDLSVHVGEVLAIVGPSGTGKSVLLKHVIGLLVPDKGDVHIDDASIARCGARELARLRQRMGYVFQDAALLDSLTVRQNLRLALSDADCRRNPMHATDRIHYALSMVNLGDSVLDKTPDELSGGMRKRVGVARAIINAPDILLYDEPTTGLDPANVDAINQLVLSTRDALGATSILVTHDLVSLATVADRVALLMRGRIAFIGSPNAFLESDDETVRSFIGGPANQGEEDEDGRILSRC